MSEPPQAANSGTPRAAAPTLVRPGPVSGRLLVGSLLITLLALAAMAYLMISGERMVSTFSSAVDASIKVKLEASLAHLWFEEHLAGDPGEEAEKAWQRLDQADDYAVRLMRDLQADGNHWSPELESESTRLRELLGEFRRIGEDRARSSSAAVAGTELDQQFDAVFKDFLDTADRVERLLQGDVDQALTRFRHTALLLMLFTAVISIAVTLVLHQLSRRQRGHFDALRDAAETIRAQNQTLNKLAHFDALTGLPNRSMFLDLLQRTLEQGSDEGMANVLFFVDLDNFKAINDSMGHHAGDLVIAEAASRLQQCVRGKDTVARLAGDEFTVLLSSLRNEDQALSTASRIARDIVDTMSRPFLPDGQEALLSCSVGIAVSPRDGSQAQDLLRHADTAMYHAKALGKSGFQFFTPDMNERVQSRIQIENGLRRAMREEQFLVHWQPQWSGDGRLRGSEALLRWLTPEHGMLLPQRFMSVAESSGLICAMGDWTLETACRQFRRWREAGLKPGLLSVNLSAMQFRREDLVDRILGMLDNQGLEPQAVELELTESVLMHQTERTLEKLRALTRAGFSIAIDDFGTGYSSMAYLHVFPVHTLKIDRSFVSRMDSDDSAAAIVDTMLSLAGHLRLSTVAEGVETQTQREALVAKGCDYLQGYLLGRPMDNAGLERCLRAQNDATDPTVSVIG